MIYDLHFSSNHHFGEEQDEILDNIDFVDRTYRYVHFKTNFFKSTTKSFCS
jgi:hypothetical protein